MAAPASRSPWPAAAAGAMAAALLALALALAGIPGPWVALAGGLALAGLVAALVTLFATRRTAAVLDTALARAATAEHERNQLQRELQRHDKLEQQLLQAKQAAEAAALAKGEFLATMSHEIRTPLNGIIPMLDLIGHGTLAEDQRQMLRTAHESSLQLLRIVDDILDYSKLEANRLELEITTFNLREPLEAMLQLMRRPAEDKGLRLELEIDPNVRLPVRGDPVRLRQVLGNLVGNAVKFTERGGVTLAVRRLGETPAQHLLRFEVRDTGIGIDPDIQARLFRAFSQADASTTRLYGGTGLGLAICKRIVDLMGGRIGVESEPSRGSTFWFEIPLLKVVGDLQRGETGGAELRQVLVVSPDVRLRQRMGLLLPPWGYAVDAVESPQEALERLRGDALPRQARGAYVAVLADHDGLRHSARALYRALARTPAYAGIRLLWLYGAEVPGELREGAELVPRMAADAELRAALQEPAGDGAGTAADTAPGGDDDTPGALAGAEPGPAPQAPETPAAPPAPPASPAPAAGPAPVHAARLLLVEDNPVNLLVAQKLLSVLGYACDTATNGEAALARLAAAEYDLVFMDCQMPVLDGYSATRRWREQEAVRGGRRLPIVAMTANVMAGDRQRCLDAGMDDYLSKPVAREQLDACLRRWLRPAPAAAQAPAPAASAAPARPAPSVPPAATPASAAAPGPVPRAAPAPGPARPAPAPAVATPPARPAAPLMPPATQPSRVAATPPRPAPAPTAPTAPGAPAAPAAGRPATPAAPAHPMAPANPAPPSTAPATPAITPVRPAAPAARASGAQATALSAVDAGIPVLDMEMLDELRAIAGDDATAIVRLFLEDAPRLVRQVEQASATPDLPAMREAAHALKSSSANIGALALSSVARRIETAARTGTLERPAVAAALLIAEFGRAREALLAWLATPGQSSSLLSR